MKMFSNSGVVDELLHFFLFFNHLRCTLVESRYSFTLKVTIYEEVLYNPRVRVEVLLHPPTILSIYSRAFLINAPTHTHTDALGTALFALYATTTSTYALPVGYLCYYYRVGRLSKRSLCFLYFEVDLER